MKGASELKELLQRIGLRRMGRGIYTPYWTPAQVANEGFDSDVMNLPVNSTEELSLLNPDGSFKFTLGISDLGGTDTLS